MNPIFCFDATKSASLVDRFVMAEVVMIPVVAACANAVAHATGKRFYQLPLSAERIKKAL